MTTPADTLLRITPLYHGGKRGEPDTCSKPEFEAANTAMRDDEDPDYERVMALQPGETMMILGGGAAGAWEVRCLTMDEAAAELDREATPIDRHDPAVIRRRDLATAGFHERVARHLSERGREGEAERARDAAGRLRTEPRP